MIDNEDIEAEIATTEEMYDEAIIRLRKLNASEQIISEYTDGNMAYYCSEKIVDDIKDKIKNIQEKYGGLVYYCEVTGGVMANLLYVSKYKEEWEMDNEELDSKSKVKTVFAYVYNLSAPDLSEFGSIGVKTDKNGIIRRVW